MSRYLCHTEPDCFEFEAHVIARRSNAVLLDRSFFYPCGGGQLADRGALRWNGGEVSIVRGEMEGGKAWHCFEETPTAAVPPERIVATVEKTSQSAPLRILKIENKGQHNRRIRIGLAR